MMSARDRLIAINRNKKKWLKLNSRLTENSGIYILTRYENEFKYGYVGQAKHILTRLAEHLLGYQHIDNSIRNHGLYSLGNVTGWQIAFFECPESELDRLEQMYIQKYANLGFQMRNKTSGGQGEGKLGIATFRENKGYYDGIKQGYKKARQEIKNLFDKYLDFSKRKDNKICERMYEKFKDFLEGV